MKTLNEGESNTIKKPASALEKVLIILLVVFLGATITMLVFYHFARWGLGLNIFVFLLILIVPALLLLGVIIIIVNIAGKRNFEISWKRPLLPTFIVLGAGVFSLLFGIGERATFKIRYTFTIEKWAKATPDERSVLVDSFLEQYDLNTFNDAMVIEYLGEPDFKEILEVGEPPSFAGYYYIYNLGFVRDFIDPTFFDIKTDASGKVVYYNVRYT